MTSEFIVLSTTKVGDNAVVVHTLSREYGRRGFIVRSGKKANPALLMPLSILEADVVENPKSQLWSLRGLSSLDALSGIRGNIEKNTMSLFIAEVLFRTIREGAFEDGLYEACVRNILTLNALEADYLNFHVWFLLDLASAMGFRPSSEDLLPFAKDDNGQALVSLLTLDFANAMMLPLSGNLRSSLCESLIRYLEFHTDQSINVKSLSVLKELYR